MILWKYVGGFTLYFDLLESCATLVNIQTNNSLTSLYEQLSRLSKNTKISRRLIQIYNSTQSAEETSR